MTSSKSGRNNDRIAYSEFGNASHEQAFERATPDLPPNQQNLRVEASRAGRKGKTVTVIRGFQMNPTAMTDLLKQLKALCGAGGAIKDDTLEIQGDHKQKLIEHLVKLGYKAKGSGG
jgi:translation initiation factor 1